MALQLPMSAVTVLTPYPDDWPIDPAWLRDAGRDDLAERFVGNVGMSAVFAVGCETLVFVTPADDVPSTLPRIIEFAGLAGLSVRLRTMGDDEPCMIPNWPGYVRHVAIAEFDTECIESEGEAWHATPC